MNDNEKALFDNLIMPATAIAAVKEVYMNITGIREFAGIAAAAAGFEVGSVSQLDDGLWVVELRAPDGQAIYAEVSHEERVGLRATIPVLPSLARFCEMFTGV